MFILVYNKITSEHLMSFEWSFHVGLAFTVLTTANAVVNRILYAVRLTVFRKIVCQLFQRS